MPKPPAVRPPSNLDEGSPFVDFARRLVAVPNAEVQAALAEEKQAKAERKKGRVNLDA
jgi:hypothetical protein